MRAHPHRLDLGASAVPVVVTNRPVTILPHRCFLFWWIVDIVHFLRRNFELLTVRLQISPANLSKRSGIIIVVLFPVPSQQAALQLISTHYPVLSPQTD